MIRERVVVAMSGGVDSSISTYLLKEQGYEVSSVTMSLQPHMQDSAVKRAAQIADKLDISHSVLELHSAFTQNVIEPFCLEYGRGKTPNPCIWCNQQIKFGALLDAALETGDGYLATGHYARIEKRADGYHLLKGVDAAKDQSYFLYTLNQQQLGRILFPLGKLSKTDVKKTAHQLGLDGLIPGESQDICFIPDGDYPAFVSAHVESEPGDIVDTSGRVLGKHKGLIYYTTGQRHGLELGGGGKLYVIRLDELNNRVVVGSRGELFNTFLSAGSLNWISGVPPQKLRALTVKIRYKSPQVAAKIQLKEDTVEVYFEQPQWAITPGQSVAFYDGDEVLGGGIILKAGQSENNESEKIKSQTVFC